MSTNSSGQLRQIVFDIFWLCLADTLWQHTHITLAHTCTHTLFDPSVSQSVSSKAVADVPVLTLNDVILR